MNRTAQTTKSSDLVDDKTASYLHELSTTWQPISTAPGSGTIRLWWRNAGETIGHFAIDEDWKPGSTTPREGWKGEADECIPCNQEDCTHWMLQSLPPPGHKFPHFEGQPAAQDSLRKALAMRPVFDKVRKMSVAASAEVR
ncbi:hypothetical protein [Paucibacter soli]|uniref:hypothetical protein n=1 Tax=Paucibacter soli TaxID=3133433 RepID=UPI0030B3D918